MFFVGYDPSTKGKIKVVKTLVYEKPDGTRGYKRLTDSKGDPITNLEVVIADGNPDNKYTFVYSTKGMFTLKQVEGKTPVFIYVKDYEHNRVVKRFGNKVIDVLEMSKQYGSTPIYNGDKYPKIIGWDFGPRQKYTREIIIVWQTPSIANATNQLKGNFGVEVAQEVMDLVTKHEEFRAQS